MTEMYDGDHDIPDLDRARSEALQAGAASGNPWTGAVQFETMMEELQSHIQEMMESLIATGDASAPDRAMATSEKFLSELVAYHPSKEDMDEKANCPVCIQDFTTDEKMHVLPCFHTFHPDCCIPWLKKHNTCPVCRHELPSDDPGWDARKQQQQAEADKDSDLSQLHDSMFG